MFNPFKRKPTRRYYFMPLEDITPYELALCMKFGLTWGAGDALFDSLPEGAKRHWQERAE